MLEGTVHNPNSTRCTGRLEVCFQPVTDKTVLFNILYVSVGPIKPVRVDVNSMEIEVKGQKACLKVRVQDRFLTGGPLVNTGAARR